MTEPTSEQEGWDKVEDSMAFREQLGEEAPAQEPITGGDSVRFEDNEDPATIQMPDESLPADDGRSFHEQLAGIDSDDSEGAFGAAAEEQLEDGSE